MYHFFVWRDGIEILFFSSLFYLFMQWLAKDQTKNLLPYFYGYCFATIGSYALQLTTINYILSWYAPVIIMLFMIMHQDTLQRNLIALKNIQPKLQENDDWLGILFRSCLVMLNKNKAITCIIECSDNLTDLLKTPFFINANIHKEILSLLLDSPAFASDKLIWVDIKGKLRGINAVWYNTAHQTTKKNDSFFLSDTWLQKSSVYTQQIDALVFYGDPITHTFSIIVQGKCFDKVSPHHTLTLIKQHIRLQSKQKKNIKKGKQNENSKTQKNHLQQRTP